jgi:hypothetical protein
MRRFRIILVFILSLAALVACGRPEESREDIGSENRDFHGGSYIYYSFEGVLSVFVTDVAVGQYVGHRAFGEALTEYEFIVSDRVLGSAADRIFVYTENREFDFAFIGDRDYMLPLTQIGLPHAKTHDDGYTLPRGIVIDLNEPPNSVMQNQPLSKHSNGLDFGHRGLSAEQIKTYVSELTKNNPPGRDFIRSERIEDILEGSPNVLIVEIGRPYRPLDMQVTTDWMETDIYYCTVVQTLKGGKEPGYEFIMIFLADTVKQGEQHIIAAEPLLDRSLSESGFYTFTSRNSLFRMRQLNLIMSIL